MSIKTKFFIAIKIHKNETFPIKKDIIPYLTLLNKKYVTLHHAFWRLRGKTYV
jgi:hypothetical protein